VEVRARASSVSEEADFEKRISNAIKRLIRIVEQHYPHPLQSVHIVAPPGKDKISVILPEKVPLPLTFSYNKIYIRWSNYVKKIEMEIFDGTIHNVGFMDDNGKEVSFDPYGDGALLYLTTPEFFNVIRRGVTIQSQTGLGKRWFTNFLTAVEEAYEYSDVLDALHLKDLMNTSIMISDLRLIFLWYPGSFYNFADATLTINKRDKTGRVLGRFTTEIAFFNDEGIIKYGKAEFDYKGDRVKQARLYLTKVDEEMFKRSVTTLLTDSLLDAVEKEVVKVLNAYKYFRVALSIMKQLGR